MQDTVAKKYYSFGVLEGNHVEERFGLDNVANLQNKVNPVVLSETREKFGLQSSMHAVNINQLNLPSVNNLQYLANNTLTQTYYSTPDKETLIKTNKNWTEHVEKDKALAFTHEGEKAHLFFGHGLKEDDLEKREFLSSYNLAYANKIKPADSIFCKFDTTTVSPVINPEDKVYIKNHMRNIVAIGDGQNLNTKKNYKHYDEFTKTYDSVHSRIAFRK